MVSVSDIYQYNFYVATVLRHKDADTTVIACDLGFHVTFTYPDGLRWDGIDAPHRTTPEGQKALAVLNELLPPGSRCLIRTRKTTRGSEEREKYGRYLAEFWSLDGMTCFNDVMLERGLVRKYTGKGRSE